MLYHSVGNGGQGAIGILLYIGLCAIFLDLAIATRRGFNTRVAGYYFVVAALYLGMGLSSEKTIFQGSFFYLPFLIAMAIALTRVVSVLSWHRALSMMMAIIVLLFAPIGLTLRSPEQRPDLEQMVDQISQQMTTTIARCSIERPQFLAITPNPVTPETIALQLLVTGKASVQPLVGYFERDEQSLTNLASEADFVLFPNERGLRESTHLPGTAFAEAVRTSLAAQNHWSIFKPDVDDAPELWSKSCTN